MELTKPTLLLDKEKVIRNIRHMARKASQNNMVLSPHFKTHQSREVGRWFKEEGINHATVSSVIMGTYFARDGWKNITIAFPVNILESEQINEMAQSVSITVLVDSVESLELLGPKLELPIEFMIEIVSDYPRTGIGFQQRELIKSIIEKSETYDNLNFKGFYSHSGNTYGAGSLSDIAQIHTKTCQVLNNLKNDFKSYNANLKVALGDTPACSTQDNFEGIDIMGPGNFVFYDLMQVALGACKEEDIAVAMACPIVYKNEERMEFVMYGGGVHFCRDYLEVDGKISFGSLVALDDAGWSDSLPGCYLRSISQEHGVAVVNEEIFNRYGIGDVIGVLPIHSCMTADSMGEYVTLEEELIDHLSGPKIPRL